MSEAAATGGAASEILRWRRLPGPIGPILGFFSIQLPSGLIINDCKLMAGPEGKHWIAMPSIKLVDRSGNPRLDASSKPAWKQIIEFDALATRERFQQMALEALRLSHPEAFE